MRWSCRWLFPLLALPLHPEEADRALLDPEAMQGRYIASIHRLLRALCSRGPVVLVCEDLHWADPASVALVSQLLPLAAQLPGGTSVVAVRSTTKHGASRIVPVLSAGA